MGIRAANPMKLEVERFQQGKDADVRILHPTTVDETLMHFDSLDWNSFCHFRVDLVDSIGLEFEGDWTTGLKAEQFEDEDKIVKTLQRRIASISEAKEVLRTFLESPEKISEFGGWVEEYSLKDFQKTEVKRALVV